MSITFKVQFASGKTLLKSIIKNAIMYAVAKRVIEKTVDKKNKSCTL